MFGTKFRSWMEAHIGRPRKKQQQSVQPGALSLSPSTKSRDRDRDRDRERDRDRGKGRGSAAQALLVASASSSAALDEEAARRSSSPLGHLDDLPTSSHLIRGPLTADSLDSVGGSSSFCGSSGVGSSLGPSGRSLSHNGNVNLSSPESAYSTGYSTDGTSPITSYPPEYYINLRTGTHYFQSAPPVATAAGPASLRPGWHWPSAVPATPGVASNCSPFTSPPTFHLSRAQPLPTATTTFSGGSLSVPAASSNSTSTTPKKKGLRNLSFLTPGRHRKQQQQQLQEQQLKQQQQIQQQQQLRLQQHQLQLESLRIAEVAGSRGSVPKPGLQPVSRLGHRRTESCDGRTSVSAVAAVTITAPPTLHLPPPPPQPPCVASAATSTTALWPMDDTGSSTISSRSTTSAASVPSTASATCSSRPAHWSGTSESVASPRPRTRIRTNPWLPTSPAPTPVTTPTPRTRNQQTQSQEIPEKAQQQRQDASAQQHSRNPIGRSDASSLSLSSSSSYGSASDVRRSRSRVPRPPPLFQSRCGPLNEESPSVEEKPLPREKSPKPAVPPRGSHPPQIANRSASPSSGSSRTANNGSPHSLVSDISDRAAAAEEDLTLNEMMGKFDESYVYEKETDILSDSDPTDCDDYGDDQGGEGGDEQTEEDLDDDLDYIDKGSANDLPTEIALLRANRGHCTYHAFGSDLVRKSSGRASSHKEGSARSSRRRQRRIATDENRSESSSRASSVRRERSDGAGIESRRSSCSRDGSCRQADDVKCNERRRKQRHCRSKERKLPNMEGPANVSADNISNVNKVMMQKFLLRSGVGPCLSGGHGSRSAESTPLSLRRRILIEEAATNRYGLVLNPSSTEEVNDRFHRSHAETKGRSNSVSSFRRQRSHSPGDRCVSSSEQALIEADKEADQRYRQLILEAEHILVSIAGSQPPLRVPHYGTPPMTKRLPLGHLNRRLDFVKNGCKTGDASGLVRRKGSLDSPLSNGRQVFSPQLVRHVREPTYNGIPNRSLNDCDGRRNGLDGCRRTPLCLSPSPLVRRELIEDRCNGNEFDNYRQWSPAVFPRRIIDGERLQDRKQTFTPSPSHFPRRSFSNQTREAEQLDNRDSTEHSVISCDNRNVRICDTVDSSVNDALHIEEISTAFGSVATPVVKRRGEPPVPPPRTCTARKDTEDGQKEEKMTAIGAIKKTFDLKLKQLPFNANNILNGRLTPRSPQQPKAWTPIENSSSESEGSKTPKFEACFEKKDKRKAVSTATTPTCQRPPLVTFKSVDLRTLDLDTAYCPQSEPVKRKIYAGSTSFDRIHKTLENTQHELKDMDGCNPVDNIDSSMGMDLGPEVTDVTIRHRMLLETIEGLKKSLQDQSDSLHETYRTEEALLKTEASS